MNKAVFISAFLFLSATGVFAQCNNELVKNAVAQSGIDAVYLKEFKVKFTRSGKADPVQTARFNTLLNEGKLYRFTVANAVEYEGEAILQLFKNNKLLGSTYHIDSGADHQKFDFLCDQTGFYKILMSFREGREGCAAGVMSLVINDSTRRSDPIILGSDTVETLYVGVENPLSIAASGASGGSLELSIDQGEIRGQKGGYYALVEREGAAMVTVVVRDSAGQVKEESAFRFLVKKIPDPVATIAGMSGGIISRSELMRARAVQINPPPGFESLHYEILRFTMSGERNAFSGYAASGGSISLQQMNFIRSLQPGSKLFIKDIVVKGPGGKEYRLAPLGFIID